MKYIITLFIILFYCWLLVDAIGKIHCEIQTVIVDGKEEEREVCK